MSPIAGLSCAADDARRAARALARGLHRYGKGTAAAAGVRRSLQTPGFRYVFVMRLCAFPRGPPATRRVVAWGLMRLWLRRLRYRFGIDVPASTRVGPGRYINHPGGIVVHSEAVTGRNCNLSHDVTVGANALVTRDVPGGSVVAGVPARVISRGGAVGYINHTDY